MTIYTHIHVLGHIHIHVCLSNLIVADGNRWMQYVPNLSEISISLTLTFLHLSHTLFASIFNQSLQLLYLLHCQNLRRNKHSITYIYNVYECTCNHKRSLTYHASYHSWAPRCPITRYGSTLYIGIAMVVPIPQYIRKCRFLLSVSSEFDF